MRTQDTALALLADEIATWPDIPDRSGWSRPSPDGADDPVPSWQVELGGEELSLFTMMSTFETPMDVTLSELSVELFFPADEATETAPRRRAKLG